MTYTNNREFSILPNSITLEGKINDIGSLRFLRAEWKYEGSRFALIRYAINGREEPLGLCLDLDKIAFIDNVDDPDLNKTVQALARTVWEIVATEQQRGNMSSISRKIIPKRIPSVRLSPDNATVLQQLQRERERLNRERDEILNQQKDLENKLTEINLELAAIDAYEAAKTGKTAMPTRRPPAPTKSEATIKELPAEPRARPQPGTRREALLRVIGENPNGLSRAEIFECMGLKGNKPAEKSVSNVLTALTKNNQVSRRERKYVIGG